jgi:hypothetical protein
LLEKVSKVSIEEVRMLREYDRHVSVDSDVFDCALVVTLRTGSTRREVRIPVEDILGFMEGVVRHGGYSLSTAASRLEVGHCETCANTGLVTEDVNGRPTNVFCPDCRDRWPAEPFKGAPKIEHRMKEGA